MNDVLNSAEGREPQQTPQVVDDRGLVEVTVAYLPSPMPFHRKYDDGTQIATVRAESMEFFHVKDYKDRNEHKFFLEFEGRLLSNLTETLEQLLGPHRRGARFNLIEQVIQG